MDRRARFDVDFVDRLARLQLAARRLGFSLCLIDVPAPLAELIELAGLGEVLCGQALRQTEGGEQAGVDEVVVPDDPVA